MRSGRHLAIALYRQHAAIRAAISSKLRSYEDTGAVCEQGP
jgi:hypothetical protein